MSAATVLTKYYGMGLIHTKSWLSKRKSPSCQLDDTHSKRKGQQYEKNDKRTCGMERRNSFWNLAHSHSRLCDLLTAGKFPLHRKRMTCSFTFKWRWQRLPHTEKKNFLKEGGTALPVFKQTHTHTPTQSKMHTQNDLFQEIQEKITKSRKC